MLRRFSSIFRTLFLLPKKERRFFIMRKLAKWIMPEYYRFNWPYIAWWNDEQFNGFLARFNEMEGLNIDRRWMLYQLLRLVDDIPGDTAECGVYRGASSYLIAKSNSENKTHQRTHFVFDSFEGLPAPCDMDGSHWQQGDLSCSLDETKKNLAEFKDISWHKGWIPERFADVENRSFSFVHIDVDIYEATRDSIKFFYPRMKNGGIILCDDYGYTICPGATRAIDEFLADKPEKMLALSCGGGFMIKSCKTAQPYKL